jgi:uncharacterized protein (DUF2249 family)
VSGGGVSRGAEVRPVAPGDRVSDVLARDEALVEVFVRRSAHFIKLRNRTMRRIMARLVTVEDAARMAGTDAAALVGELNAALGIAVEPGPSGGRSLEAGPIGPIAEGAGDATRHPSSARIVEVDVREDLRSGREPFSKIMAAVREVGAGEVLRLRTTFEPVPLYTVLAKRGFLHEAEADGPEDWSVWFWLPEDSDVGPAASNAAVSNAAPAAPAGHPAAGPDPQDPAAATVRLDVRGLEPPEPMVRTLAALETLPAGHTLVQLNVRVPQFLLPILAERGFAWEVDESPADHVVVRIRRPA